MNTGRDEREIPAEYEQIAAARSQDQPLLPFQRYFLDYQLYSPRLKISNITISCRIPAGRVDAQALKKAVDRVVHHYAIFGTIFTFNDDGELVQRFRPDLVPDIRILRTDEEQYENHDRRVFVQPYRLLDSLLWRHQILVTDQNLYLLFDLHHSIADKQSCMSFFREIFRVLDGGSPGADCYYLYLQRHAQHMRSAAAAADLRRLEALCGGSWSCMPKPDMDARGNANARCILQTDHTPAFYRAAAGRLGTTFGRALCAAGLLALSRFNGQSRVQVAWEYHGRAQAWEKSLVGLTLSSLPFALDLSSVKTREGILQELERQSALQHRLSRYSYALHGMSPGLFERMQICYLPGNDDPGNMPEGSDMFVYFDGLDGMMGLAQILIAENGSDAPLTLICAYQATRYLPESMDRLLALYLEALDELLCLD